MPNNLPKKSLKASVIILNYFGENVIEKARNFFKQFLPYINESLPINLIEKLRLLPIKEALFQIHFPESPEKLRKAQFRLKFDELFFIQLNLLKLKVL